MTSLNQKDKRSTPKKTEDKYDLLSVIKNVVFLVAIYAYFVGWVYQYYFLRHFGVSLSIVDTSFQSFFVYSYSALASPYGIAVSGIALLTICLLTKFFPKMEYTIVVILIVLFPVLFVMARNEGESKSADVRIGGTARTIRFILNKEHYLLYPSDFLEANKTSNLRLVTETKDRFIVINQPRGEGGAVPYAKAYDVPRSAIVLAEITLPTPSLKVRAR